MAVPAEPWPDIATLSQAWTARMGNTPPLGNALRAALPQQWVRFHYLPDSRRIATSRTDRAEVQQRFQAVLAALGADDEERLLVATCGWGRSAPAPRPPDLAALLPGSPWCDVPPASLDDPAATVYATALNGDSDGGLLTEFLLVWVADAMTAEAIVAAPGLQWLVHPYDGGMDVIAPDELARDALAERFEDWLSPRPDGL